MNTFVTLHVKDMFDNIQHFRNSDGSITNSSPIGFGPDRYTDTSADTDFSSVINDYMDKSKPDIANTIEKSLDKQSHSNQFSTCDTNNDGVLTMDEIKDALGY